MLVSTLAFTCIVQGRFVNEIITVITFFGNMDDKFPIASVAKP